jgi:VCBS repeat-containing protein
VTQALSTSDINTLKSWISSATSKENGSISGLTQLKFSAPASALDYLKAGEVLTLTYTVAVNDGDGGVDSETFVVNITGTNDLPTIARSKADHMFTDDSAVANEVFAIQSGTLSKTDADHNDLHTYALIGVSGVQNSTTVVATTSAEQVTYGVGYTQKVIGAYGTMYFDASAGAYQFVPDPVWSKCRYYVYCQDE